MGNHDLSPEQRGPGSTVVLGTIDASQAFRLQDEAQLALTHDELIAAYSRPFWIEHAVQGRRDEEPVVKRRVGYVEGPVIFDYAVQLNVDLSDEVQRQNLHLQLDRFDLNISEGTEDDRTRLGPALDKDRLETEGAVLYERDELPPHPRGGVGLYLRVGRYPRLAANLDALREGTDVARYDTFANVHRRNAVKVDPRLRLQSS